jgi:hypothetical protein
VSRLALKARPLTRYQSCSGIVTARFDHLALNNGPAPLSLSKAVTAFLGAVEQYILAMIAIRKQSKK